VSRSVPEEWEFYLANGLDLRNGGIGIGLDLRNGEIGIGGE